jgi:hypothetical protein
VHLDRRVDDVVHDRRAVVLDHRDVGPCGLATQMLELPRRLEREQAGGFDPRRQVGDLVLDHLLVAERTAVHRPADRPFAQHVEGAVHHPEPPHGVVHPARTEPLLRERERIALAPEDVFVGHAHVVVGDLGVVVDRACPALVAQVPRARERMPGVSLGTMIIDMREEGVCLGVGDRPSRCGRRCGRRCSRTTWCRR